MPIEIAVLQEFGEILWCEIPQNIIQAAKSLPFAPTRYFLVDEDTITVPVSALVQMRARQTGIENAVKLMQLAYEGKHAPREPISLHLQEGGSYLVVDGNSTAIVAKAAGWPTVPAILLP